MTPQPLNGSVKASARAVPRWKIVGGAFVHFALPLYLLAAISDGLRYAAQGSAAALVISGVLHDSAFGLPVYLGVAILATALALALDRIGGWRQHAFDSEADIIARFSHALNQARGRFGPRADAVLGQLAFTSNRDETRVVALAQHGEALLTASLQALASAPTERHQAIAARTAEALESLAREAHDLDVAAGALHDEHAAALARFVVARYGGSTLDQSSDSAGDAR